MKQSKEILKNNKNVRKRNTNDDEVANNEIVYTAEAREEMT